MTEEQTGPVDVPGAEIAGDFDRQGTLMSERQSYERVIEGAKMASDGCRNLEPHFPNSGWEQQAGLIDMVRVACAGLWGSNDTRDTIITPLRFGGAFMSRNQAYSRVYDGLTMMAAGSRQVAVCHRNDIRWSKIAFMVQSLRDSAGEIIRKKKQSIIGMH